MGQGTNKFSGGVLAPNGRVIMVPRKAVGIGVLDPATKSFSLINLPEGLDDNYKFAGGVLARGHIYFVPASLEVIGDFNPATGAFQTVDISPFITINKK